MVANSPDRLALHIRWILVILGAFLCIAGWYRWFA
jgi:hypothetical protein